MPPTKAAFKGRNARFNPMRQRVAVNMPFRAPRSTAAKRRGRSNAKRRGFVNIVKTIPQVQPFTANQIPNQINVNLLYFDLATIPEHQTYCDLYDEYKLNKITIKFFPLFDNVAAGDLNANTSVTGAAIWNSDLVTAVDYNALNTTAPTTFEQILSYGTHKRTAFSQNHVRTFIPKMNQVMSVALPNGNTVSVNTAVNRWMECNNGTTVFPYYGLHVMANAWGNGATATTGFVPTWRYEVTYDLSYRSSK